MPRKPEPSISMSPLAIFLESQDSYDVPRQLSALIKAQIITPTEGRQAFDELLKNELIEVNIDEILDLISEAVIDTSTARQMMGLSA